MRLANNTGEREAPKCDEKWTESFSEFVCFREYSVDGMINILHKRLPLPEELKILSLNAKQVINLT